MDTLLQFEENLSDQEVAARINEVAEAAMAGDTGAEERLEAMLHRWPGCTALLFNAAAVYDGFELFFPAADEEARRRWKTRKRALLEEIRRTGTAAYWQAATIQLASLAAASFARYVEVLTGPPVLPDEDLFFPGLAYTSPDVQQAMPQPMRRMLLQSITGEEKYRPLLADPVAAAALDKLKASV